VSRLGGVARPLVKASYACWFATDGSRIVTGSAEPSAPVALVDRATGEVDHLRLHDNAWVADIDCSVRAGSILAVTENSEKFQIRTLKAGGEEHKLFEGNDAIYSARWSPEGDSIYYLHGKGGTSELSKITVQGGNEPVAIVNGLQTGD